MLSLPRLRLTFPGRYCDIIWRGKKERSDNGGGKREKLPLVKGYTAKDDVKAVMKQYNLPERFPKVVLDEAKRV